MRTKKTTTQPDEIIAFVLFIICCVISFFSQSGNGSIPFTIIN
ncbi:MAG: hypothetical protein R2825_01380 [Saprospiraceae bacterium]